MLKYYKIQNGVTEIKEPQNYDDINVIYMEDPEYEEIKLISKREKILYSYFKDALDKNEIPHIEGDAEQVFLLFRTALENKSKKREISFETIPLGLILAKDKLIIISSVNTKILDVVIGNYGRKIHSIKELASTIIMAVIKRYLKYLKILNIKIINAEEKLRKYLKNEDLLELMEIEKSLVFFTTSIKGNQLLLEKILSSKKMMLSEEEKDFFEDVLIENKQALEMSQVYANILDSLTEAFGSIISNNLNLVMKTLAALTIILNFPMLISSIYGMNVPLPFQENTYAFLIVMAMLSGFGILGTLVFMKRKWF